MDFEFEMLLLTFQTHTYLTTNKHSRFTTIKFYLSVSIVMKLQSDFKQLAKFFNLWPPHKHFTIRLASSIHSKLRHLLLSLRSSSAILLPSFIKIVLADNMCLKIHCRTLSSLNYAALYIHSSHTSLGNLNFSLYL